MTIYTAKRGYIVFVALIFVLTSTFTTTAQTQFPDLLAYIVNNFDGKVDLMLYDPLSQTKRLLQGNIDPERFTFSQDRRVAVSSKQNANSQILILDAQYADTAPVRITQEPDANNYPLAWSPDNRYLTFVSHSTRLDHSSKLYVLDTQNINSTSIEIAHTPNSSEYVARWSSDSRYLAFASNQLSSASMYIWDGQKSMNIEPASDTHPINPAKAYYGFTWSSTGQLAFTRHDILEFRDIYLWDGKSTTRVNQPLMRHNMGSAWSMDGKLAFLSEKNNDYDLLVWDGISFKDGVPDQSKYINMAASITDYLSFPHWTSDGLLTFIGQGPQDTFLQFYMWDGKTVTNISHSRDAGNYEASLSGDGRWAFSTIRTFQRLIHVRDQNDHTLLIVDGLWPGWGSHGNLAYCTARWTLSVWDGKSISRIAQGADIWAQWLGGDSLHCWSG